MHAISFTQLAIVTGLALAAPLIVQLRPQLHVPSAVVEVALGIVVGPAVLGWLHIDQPVQILSDLGLATLLFLAGLEIDLRALRRGAVSLALAGVIALIISQFEDLDSPLFVAFALASSSVGVVVPILRDAGSLESRFGQAVLAGASIGEFGAILLLSLFFSGKSSSTGSRVLLLGLFGAFIIAAAAALRGLRSSDRAGATLRRLERTSAQLGVRFVVAIVAGFAALAGALGLESVLAVFVAGLILRLVDEDEQLIHTEFRLKLDAIGYGFLVPVFFITSGMALDFKGLFGDPSHLILVPVFLLALLLARGLPALLARRRLGDRHAVAMGLLQSASLPVLAIAASLGHRLHVFDDPTDAALLLAGGLSVMVFPPAALWALERGRGAAVAS
jgi:Kef-type K+ transport system membrane component KefB